MPKALATLTDENAALREEIARLKADVAEHVPPEAGPPKAVRQSPDDRVTFIIPRTPTGIPPSIQGKKYPAGSRFEGPRHLGQQLLSMIDARTRIEQELTMPRGNASGPGGQGIIGSGDVSSQIIARQPSRVVPS